MAAILRREGALGTAWMLKERLRALSCTHPGVCGARARAVDRRGGSVRLARLPAHGADAGPLAHRSAQLLAAPITNAVVEGKHNRVKVLKRRAYGYRNERTLLRILNLIHTH